MSFATLYRASGLALILGAALGSIGHVFSSILFTDQFTSAVWSVMELLSFIGLMLVTLGLPALCVCQAKRAGWLGFSGFALTVIGSFLFTSAALTWLLILPWLARVAPQLAASNGPAAGFILFLVAGLLLTVGSALLGIATMRAGVFPRWAGLLILVGAIVTLAGLAPLPDVISTIVGSAAYVILMGGIAWVGYALLSTGGAEEAQVATAAALAGS